MRRARKLQINVGVAICSQTFLRRNRQPSRIGEDRTHNEEIADRQEAFSWHHRHMYRPHQHYTYDPTNWNREAFEAAKKKSEHLSILDRLKNLEEREKERGVNLAAMASKMDNISRAEKNSSSGGGSAVQLSAEDLFEKEAEGEKLAEQSKGNGVSLQRLLEDLEERHAALVNIRGPHGNLVAYERLAVTYTDALEAAFATLRSLSLQDGTISILSATCLWHHLLRGVALLSWRLVSPNQEVDDAEKTIASAMWSCFLSSAPAVIACEAPHAERDIELLDVLLHPFTRKHFHQEVCGEEGKRASCETISRVVQLAIRSIRERLAEAEKDEIYAIPLSLHHCAVAGHCAVRLAELGDCSGAQQVIRVALDASLAAMRPMRQDAIDAVAAMDGAGMTALEMQLSPRANNASRRYDPTVKRSRPTGIIRQAPVSVDDTREAVLAASHVGRALMMVSVGEQPSSSSLVAEWSQAAGSALVLHRLVLELLEHSPNYHLPVPAIVRLFASPFFQLALAEALLHQKKPSQRLQESSGRTGDRKAVGLVSSAWLLASRLTSRLTQTSDEDVVSLLDITCCRLPIEVAAPAAARDWARQRGILAQRLMGQVTVRDAAAADKVVSALQNGHYRGRIDIGLWRKLVVRGYKLLRTTDQTEQLVMLNCEQLIALRGRCWREGCSVAQQRHRKPLSADSSEAQERFLEPISDDDAAILAKLFASVIRSQDVTAAAILAGDELAWRMLHDKLIGSCEAEVVCVLRDLFDAVGAAKQKERRAEAE